MARRNTSDNSPISEESEAVFRQIAADVEAAATASEQRLRELAARLPGGAAVNYIAVLCDFLASEYGWGLDTIAGLDSRQMILFVEQALRRRRASKRRKGGRPTKAEKDSATKVIAALAKHHGYEENGSVTNYEPAKNRELAKVYKLSPNALSRFLTDALGKGGYKKYAIACRDKEIGNMLALWRRELPGRLADLRSEESGRGEGD